MNKTNRHSSTHTVVCKHHIRIEKERKKEREKIAKWMQYSEMWHQPQPQPQPHHINELWWNNIVLVFVSRYRNWLLFQLLFVGAHLRRRCLVELVVNCRSYSILMRNLKHMIGNTHTHTHIHGTHVQELGNRRWTCAVCYVHALGRRFFSPRLRFKSFQMKMSFGAVNMARFQAKRIHDENDDKNKKKNDNFFAIGKFIMCFLRCLYTK